jgi:hypothetical protein
MMGVQFFPHAVWALDAAWDILARDQQKAALINTMTALLLRAEAKRDLPYVFSVSTVRRRWLPAGMPGPASAAMVG